MSFKDQITQTTSLGYFEGQIPINYKYTMGVAGELFFRKIMEKGEFIASKCSECDTKTIYPLIYCENCFAEIKEYVSVGLEGELYSWTECYSDYQGNHYDKPHQMGMVKFPGIEGGIIHRLNIDTAEIMIGMKVIAILKPAKQRKGSIDDILYFKKA
jgi:hypothetical protein